MSLVAEALVSAYHDHWDREVRDSGIPVRFNKTDTVDTVHALAHRMIAAFLASTLARPKGTIVGIEEPLWIALDNELPDVLGVVDLVTVCEGSLHVVDFKTSRSRWTPQKAQEGADQLVLYGQTVRHASQAAGLDVKLHFAILTKHKTPLVQILPVAGDAHRVAVMKESITAVW